MTFLEIAGVIIIIGILAGIALGGFVVIYESKKSRQRKNYREGL